MAEGPGPSEWDAMATAIGAGIATVAGVIVEIGRRLKQPGSGEQQKRMDRFQRNQARMIVLLKENHETLKTLDDVLRHPDDTNFGTGKVQQTLKHMEQQLRDIEQDLRNLK